MSDFWRSTLTGADNKSGDIARVSVAVVLGALLIVTLADVSVAAVGAFIVKPASYTELLSGTASLATHLATLIGSFGAFLGVACWGINAKRESEPR